MFSEMPEKRQIISDKDFENKEKIIAEKDLENAILRAKIKDFEENWRESIKGYVCIH